MWACQSSVGNEGTDCVCSWSCSKNVVHVGIYAICVTGGLPGLLCMNGAFPRVRLLPPRRTIVSISAMLNYRYLNCLFEYVYRLSSRLIPLKRPFLATLVMFLEIDVVTLFTVASP